MLDKRRSFFDVVNLVQNVKRAFVTVKEPVDDRTEEEKRRMALESTKAEYNSFTHVGVEEVIHNFGVDPKAGLSTLEADQRLMEHGLNELTKPPPKPLWKLFLEQFQDLLVILLIVASLISLGLGEYAAASVIIIIIVANAVLGVVQEARAGKALDALESMAAPKASVIRDGKVLSVESSMLVPGDLVIMDLGAKVPADIRLIESQGLLSNEMAMTGESEPVKKDAAHVCGRILDEEKSDDKIEKKKKEDALTDPNMVYMGCAVQDGRGRGIVVKTGMQTKMGEIAHLMNTATKGASPLQEKLDKLGVKLGLASILVSLIVFVVGVTSGRGATEDNMSDRVLEMLLVAVSLTVAAVPEGLPACVTITLAVGMKEMVKKNALIRNLHSVETLGSASVICTDKTGTLTAGQMTAKQLWFNGRTFFITGAGFDPHGRVIPLEADRRNEAAVEAASKELAGGRHELPILLSVLCSNAQLQYDDEKQVWDCVGNSSERPLVVAGEKVGFNKERLSKEYQRFAENPFNSARKMMSVLVGVKKENEHLFESGSHMSVVKGAPNVVLKNCNYVMTDDGVKKISEDEKALILDQIDHFSSQALRVLAIAYGQNRSPDATGADDLEQDLVLSGLVASIDPEREEVKDSVEKAYNAGIRVVMITGDYVKTAKAIAENIGILPRGSPEAKAVDCAVIREHGDKIARLEEQLEGAVNKVEVQQQLDRVLSSLDAITLYADVYARAKPVDKITIVRSLQRQGNICSMTGDGVNDAPALKQANIGVAMGITGTDVAKASADMVLTDDNFCSIVEAIEQGRTIYANITKFVFYLLSTNVSEVLLILFSTAVLGVVSPLVPIQILWMNLTTDGAPAIALAIENTEPGIMDQGPRPKSEPLLEKVMLTGIAIQTFTLTSLAVGLYVIGLHHHVGVWNGENKWISKDEQDEGIRKAQTMIIIFIVFAELLRAYTCRSLRESIFRMGIFSNQWMQKATGISIVATLIVAHTPGLMGAFGMEYLDGTSWALVLCFSIIPAIVDEVTKLIYRMTDFGKRPRANMDRDSISGAAPMRTKSGFYEQFIDDDNVV